MSEAGQRVYCTSKAGDVIGIPGMGSPGTVVFPEKYREAWATPDRPPQCRSCDIGLEVEAMMNRHGCGRSVIPGYQFLFTKRTLYCKVHSCAEPGCRLI
jgi:hypothetical protein